MVLEADKELAAARERLESGAPPVAVAVAPMPAQNDDPQHPAPPPVPLLPMPARVRAFLDGELCIDARYFGNVGRFIKHRAVPSTVPLGQEPQPMLIQRCVHNRPDLTFPKLALFAARRIEAGTELLL